MQKQRHGDPKAIPIRSEEQTGRRKSENDLICDELRTHPNLDLRFKTEARTRRKSRRTVQRWVGDDFNLPRWIGEPIECEHVTDSVAFRHVRVEPVGPICRSSDFTALPLSLGFLY
nr:hypothetical protein Itr_chr03CG03910 [Ipomoea trifida]